jgi:hypothetical protein
MIYKHRGYLVKPHKEFPKTFIIVTEGQGGKIPNVLSGLFTSKGTACDSIDGYLSKKVKTNAETVS